MMALSELRAATGAEQRHGDAVFERVVIDSRAVQAGDLFVALRGERHDGHAFVAQARAAGAVAALVADWVDVELPQLRVDDTLAGLQQLATLWRARFSIPVVGVTGSNGKTTTKQMLAAIFAARGPVLATRGNLNNHIGVPLTLLSLRDEHRTAVVEMGANHLGEIAALAAVARPDVGVVTQAGDAHLEGFGSRDGVAHGKGELFASLDGGVAVINADDAYAALWRGLAARASVITFGIAAAADVCAQQIQPEPLADAVGSRFVLRTPGGSASVRLPMPGRHNVMNALAAAGCAVALGLEPETIAAGLGRVECAQGRLSWQRTAQGARVLDDSYNANPTSLHAALELLAGLPGTRWVVLGSMAELGPDALRLHFEAGRKARALGIERLLALGTLAAEAARGFGSGAETFDNAQALGDWLQPRLDADAVVLVKGSRSARMERVVEALGGRAGGSH
ncbi:MAG: UDP-N-acetylmuramoyl-tripeptide--D-alanyl-D-alanine ligase [Gammaproteobacteria bacterium]